MIMCLGDEAFRAGVLNLWPMLPQYPACGASHMKFGGRRVVAVNMSTLYHCQVPKPQALWSWKGLFHDDL